MMQIFKICGVSRSLATRELAREIHKKLKNDKIITVDFSGVEVMSRSFANEWLSLEKNERIHINLINVSKNAQLMFHYANIKVDDSVLVKSKCLTISPKELLSIEA